MKPLAAASGGLCAKPRTDPQLVDGRGLARLAGRRPDSKKLQVILKQIAEKIPADAVIFDVSTDRGIRAGSQTMTEIMHRCFVR